MRAAVTGAQGRVGTPLLTALDKRSVEVLAWGRPEFDLDDAEAARVVERTRPDVVFHCAAWTDVDACARDPGLALRRNGAATARLAQACAQFGSALVYLSTNEVFDGLRVDGRAYGEHDQAIPANAYGVSKLAGEDGVRAAFGAHGRAWIARTSWVFGGKNDFPSKVIAAARGLADGQVLRMVSDEVGRPTHAVDLARALAELTDVEPGTYHLANAGQASRFEWARAVLDRCLPGAAMMPISLDDYARPSRPPRWGVLGSERAAGAGIVLRPWRDALDGYLAELCRS